MIRNEHFETTLSGTTGNITSFLSNNNLGYAPDPQIVKSTYGKVLGMSGSDSIYNDTID